MRLKMVKGMLRNVGNAQVWVSLYLSFCRLGLSSDDLDEGGFAGAIGADNGDAGCHVCLQVDVDKLRSGRSWVLESQFLAPHYWFFSRPARCTAW
jgi:hypothetical protein